MELCAGEAAQDRDQNSDEHRSLQPELLDARAAVGRARVAEVHGIAAATQQEDGQHGHHGDEANHQAAAANHAHFLNAFEVGQHHGEERPGSGQGPRENPLAGIDHRLGQRCFRGLAVAQFLLVSGNQVHPVINGQADQDGHEGDGQDVQVADGEGGEGERVSQAHDQANRGFDRPSRLLVAINEDQGAKDQRHNTGHGGVLLRLLHLVVLQDRLALDLLDKPAQALDRVAVERFVGRLGCDQVNLVACEGDIDLLFGVIARVEQGRDARRGRPA